MTDWGKTLMVVGVLLLVLGGILWLGKMFHLPLGKLPGDFHVDRGNFRFYFPLTTCLILSVILSVVFWFMRRK